ncbi:MAG: Ig-like domain-containing protein, partial [Ruminococcus sp.]|nr:Ig-like domain-containing protein [Ruminococcus sp.]
TQATEQTQATQQTQQTEQTQATQQTQQTQATQQSQATDKLTASVKLNGVEVKTLEVTESSITVSYSLKADKLITDGDLALSYDGTKLTLTDVTLPNIKSNVTKSPALTANPYLINFTGVNQSTHSGTYDFTNGAVLLTAKFSVKSGSVGTADVNLEIKELDALVNDVATSYFSDSAATTEGQALVPSLSNPTVENGTATEQTQATQPTSETQATQPTSQTQATQPTSETQATQPTSQTQATQPTSPSQTPTQGPQTTIKLTAAKKQIYVNASTTVKATVNYGYGATSFKSSNTKVATVSAAGKVTGKKAGTVTITATNNGKVATVKIKVVKRANTMTVKAKTITAKSAKKMTFTKAKAFTIKKAKGKVTFTKKSGNKKITINKKTGKITVKKGLKKGTYKVKIKVRAAGNTVYKAKTKTVTVKVKVK